MMSRPVAAGDAPEDRRAQLVLEIGLLPFDPEIDVAETPTLETIQRAQQFIASVSDPGLLTFVPELGPEMEPGDPYLLYTVDCFQQNVEVTLQLHKVGEEARQLRIVYLKFKENGVTVLGQASGPVFGGFVFHRRKPAFNNAATVEDFEDALRWLRDNPLPVV